MTKPWYEKGLKFKCTECGKCCTGAPGYVWVSEEEVEEMAKTLDIPVEKFVKLYTRKVGGKLSLKENLSTYDCVFLRDGNKCMVYKARPKQCRTFPFWPENMKSKKAWDELTTYCEGVNHEEAPIIPLSVIKNNLDEMEE